MNKKSELAKDGPLMETIKAPIPERDKITRTKWRFWPSEASCRTPDGKVVGKCMRAIYYDWIGADKTNPVDEFVKTLGKIGIFLEERTRDELKRKGVYLDDDNKKRQRKFKVELFDDAVLSGEVDILIGNKDDKCGVEVKNYSNSTYKILSRPKDNHLLQTFLYVYFYEPRQPYFVIYYRPSMISKYAESDVLHRVDWVDIDGEVHPVINGEVDKSISISGIVKRYKEAKLYIEHGVLPKREFTKSSKECTQCVYRNRCWIQDGDGKKLKDGVV